MSSVLFWAETVFKSLKLTGKSNSSYITTYFHCDIFWHLGRQDKANYRPDSGNSDSSVEPVKKRRRPPVGRQGDQNTSILFSVSGVE